jgi:predicted nucleic acid-binding Zn ribbon protein
MRTSAPKDIGSAISSVVQQLGIGPRLKQFEMLEAWPLIVGEQIAKVTVAERIDRGKLFVHVTRSTWRNELTFLKKALIMKINKEMEQEIVKDIIFR